MSQHTTGAAGLTDDLQALAGILDTLLVGLEVLERQIAACHDVPGWVSPAAERYRDRLVQLVARLALTEDGLREVRASLRGATAEALAHRSQALAGAALMGGA